MSERIPQSLNEWKWPYKTFDLYVCVCVSVCMYACVYV